MNPQRKIRKILNVFEGEFMSGEIAFKKTGRHSDAFACVVSGRVEYLFSDHSFIATPENFFYLAKGSLYGIRIYEPSRYICIDFESEPSQDDADGELFSVESPLVRNTFEQIFHVWMERNPWYEPETLGIFYGLLSQAVRSCHRERDRVHRKYSDLVAFILKNYASPEFTVKSLSEFSGLSEVHVRRIFHASIGLAPAKYICLLRLEKAKNMLLTSDYTVEEIARATGIPDPYYFSRMFKKELGVSPSAFRRLHSAP